MGVLGYHPAALPQNRGRHPIVWALALGLQKTASTFFFLDEGADSGDILSQSEVPIGANDDAGVLYSKLTKVALCQIENFFPKLESNCYSRLKQNSHEANSWRRRGDKDGLIDWRMSSVSVHNLVRALAKPYVGAHFFFNGKEFRVWKSVVVNEVPINLEPGKVVNVFDQTIVVKCGVGAIKISKIEPFLDICVGDYL
jgi:methionyl-tRNA formyltransferase